MQQLKKLFTNGHLHCGLQVPYLSHLKKCTAIICVSSFHLFSVNYFILTSGLQQVSESTTHHSIFHLQCTSSQMSKKRNPFFFLIKIHKLTMCKIHCIVRDMSSSIISVSLLTIHLKRATCICVLSVRNNQVCSFSTTYIAITCTMYILYQPSYD